MDRLAEALAPVVARSERQVRRRECFELLLRRVDETDGITGGGEKQS